MIDEKRIIETFKWLVCIDSVSREEGILCRELEKKLKLLGADVYTDDAAEKTGGNSGNLIAKFKGNTDAPIMMLNAHMDTVEPGRGIIPVFRDGEFTSSGDTILGADDKSAIAILLEAITVVLENDLPHGPIELVLTVCEELGLLGAKHLDYGLIDATFGFALDTTDTACIVTRAPASNQIEIEIHGKDAHAGIAPEKGINAICLASNALSRIKIGRIDHETTCNIGVINGGYATNIVPSLVTLKGEARSHDLKKLDDVTETIRMGFEKAVAEHQPRSDEDGLPSLMFKVEPDFPATNIPEDHPVVILALKAAENLGREMKCKTTGGGADANILFEKGIITGVLGTGMINMHTVRESVRIDDLIKTVDLILEIIRLHAGKEAGTLGR
jgi:tripeptide aminopeptidase